METKLESFLGGSAKFCLIVGIGIIILATVFGLFLGGLGGAVLSLWAMRPIIHLTIQIGLFLLFLYKNYEFVSRQGIALYVLVGIHFATLCMFLWWPFLMFTTNFFYVFGGSVFTPLWLSLLVMLFFIILITILKKHEDRKRIKEDIKEIQKR